METTPYSAGILTGEIRKKRMRITFSCSNCRHSKQKCNRETPCMTCVLRGKQDSCSYGNGVTPTSLNRKRQSVEGPTNLDELTLSDAFFKQPSEAETYEYSPPTKEDSASNNTGSPPDLASYGYSSVNGYNSAGILQKLENLELGGSKAAISASHARPPPRRRNDDIRLCKAALDIYRTVLQQLPCPSCVGNLVEVFFTEVNWQYAILDRNYFIPKLEQFYHHHPLHPPSPPTEAGANNNNHNEDTTATFSANKLIFSALLFQVLAYALQFLPPGYSNNLHASCLKAIHEDANVDGAVSSDPTMRLLGLLPKDVINLDYIAAQILRVGWLKNRGLIAESWLVVVQAATNAQEMGLHRDDGKLYASDPESAIEELWDVVLRRRLMINMYLWDSGMGMVLGKPLNFKLNDYTIVPPTDCALPMNRKSAGAPFARTEFDKPNIFTLCLLEYNVHKYFPEVRELELEGPCPRDPGKVERLHRIALDYIAAIPPAFRNENPDTSFDHEFPRLASQREFLWATVWMFVLMLHRPYIFSNAKSRTEIMKASIEMLKAQQRFFDTLSPHHYRMFTLAYLTVEPCVSMLAVLIAFPLENPELAPEGFRRAQESLARLNKIRDANRVAGQGADVIQNLLCRAERNQPTWSPPAPASKSSSSPSSDSFKTPSSHGAPTQPFYPYSGEPAMFAGNTSFGDISDWDMSFQQPQQPQQSHQQDGSSSSVALLDGMNSNYTFDTTPFRPVADLTYNDLALAMSDEGFSADAGPDGIGHELPTQQFRGDFGEGSFWNFVNRGSSM